jgi:hypothetical protein
MNSKSKKIVIAIVVIIAIAGAGIFAWKKGIFRPTKGKLINTNAIQGPLNNGQVSPISGEACADWNRRPFAIMQPSDVSARPLAGISDADMVVEMPAVFGDITRLMAFYVCGNPEKIGSIRSARHDYIPIAAGLDAIYVHWGGSHFALDHLNQNIIDDMNCNNDGGKSAGQYCYREQQTGNMISDDTGYAKFATLIQGAQNFGYNLKGNLVGYPHQADAPADQRPTGGTLRVGYPHPWDDVFTYDKDSNSYLRNWGGSPDLDRNDNKQIAPKNIVVMVAAGAQMESQYANFQVGDPWYDQSDSGSATFYMNGKQTQGTWKKDKSNLNSKLTFYDSSGSEVQFVTGQIWVSIVDPGIGVKWTPGTDATSTPATTTTTGN